MSKKTETAVIPVDIKLHELAKEIGIPSKDLLAKANELGMKLKSHASQLKPGQADRLRIKFRGGGEKLKADLKEKVTLAITKEKAKPSGKAARVVVEDDSADVQEPMVAEFPPVKEETAPPAEAAAVEAPAAEAPAPASVEVEPVAAQAVEATPPPPAPVRTPTPVEVQAAVAQAPAETTAVAPAPPAPVVAGAPAPAPSTPTAAAVAAPAAEAKPAPKPFVMPPPKRVLSGPTIAPIVQRPLQPDPSRFGVIRAAPEPPPKPATAPGGKGRKGQAATAVESKSIEEFKPQVSYPTIPAGMTSEDDERGGGRGAAARGLRSGPGMPQRAGMPQRGRGPMRGAPGIKGFSSGPRRGVALLRGDDERFRGRRPKQRPMAPKITVKREGPADVTSPVSIKDLCEALGVKANDLVKKFLTEGKAVTLNTMLPDDDAMLYALEFDPLKFGIKIKKARDVEEELLKKAEVADKPEDIKPRAPVVTIMGHVDHGKTSLLDYIRHTKVAAGEAGGITQHIGAYRVPHTKGAVSFIDTPGHKAFTEMRARGANVTDVVVLVVAATDGVMPQTEEAISHARTANKKIVVALNKVDLPEADPNRVKGQLAAKELFVEGYGGEVGCVEVSAKTGQGVDELLDRILLEAEILELKANPDKPAIGTVIEAHKDQGRGIVCTLLVQEGTLRQGDVIICGHAYGPVRQIFSDTMRPLKEAGPSTPVLATGLNDVPLSGERFHVLNAIKEAAEIAETRAMRLRQEGLIKRTHVTLENLSDMLAQGAVASLKIVLKVDVQGSLTPVRNAIAELSGPDARIDILHDGVGAINETDVLLADASDAIVIGFSVTADPGARRLADERNVDLRIYNIIYEVVSEVRGALEGMLKPIEREVIQGHATVRQTFKISKIGTIAGCFVNDGELKRASGIRLVRDGKPVWTGKLASLKRVKDDVREVRSGFECGIKLEGFDDIKQGDTLEAFGVEQVKRVLEVK